VRTALVARLFGLRLLTVEGSVLLMPLPFGMPEDHSTPPRIASRHPANAKVTGVRPLGRRSAQGRLNPGIGSRLDASARLIDESVEDLRALDAGAGGRQRFDARPVIAAGGVGRDSWGDGRASRRL
jgi:hypothetical protein